MKILSPFKWLVAALLPLLTQAQTPLSIQQAMHDAAAGHPELKAAEARAQAAHAQWRQTIGYHLPALDVSEAFIRTGNPAEAFALQLNQERFSMAEFGNPANDPNNPELLNTYMTRVSATLPVFTGGMLYARSQQAGHLAKAADLELTRSRDQVTLKAASAWLDLRKAREYRDLMQHALATAEAHQQKAKEYFDQGMLAPSDILRAEVFVAEIKEYAARAAEQEQLALAALNFQRGHPQAEPVELAELDDDAVRADDTLLTVERALAQRPDLRAAREKLKAAEGEITVSRSTFLPQIGLAAHFDRYDDKLLGDHGTSWAIMGQATLNVFHGGADRNAWKKAALDAQAGAQDLRHFAEGLELEVRQALAALTSATQRLHAAQTAQHSSRENLRVIEARYAQGAAPMTDLLDAQTSLRELDVRELTARYDKQLALYTLRVATGQIILHDEP